MAAPIYSATGKPYPTRDRSASSQIDAPGAYFDERRAAKAVAFFPRFLRHSKGEFAGQRFLLEPWQSQLTEDLWGWRRADGTRLYRRAFVAVPRKNGKTTTAAGVGLGLMVGDGERGAEVYSIAGNKDQARVCFDEARAMVQQSTQLSEHIESLAHALYCANLRASFKPLASKAATLHGKNPHGVIGDEVHVWKDRELFDVMRSALGARRQPLEFYITTAGSNKLTVAWELWEYALLVRAGVINDPAFLPVMFAAEPGDDWQDPATWAKANPNFGRSVRPEYIAEECERAKRIAAQENSFKQLHLNMWTEQAVRWIPMEAWCDTANAAPFDEDELVGRACYMGLDLAYTRDLSAIALVFPPCAGDPCWRVIMRFFLPEEGLRLRAMRDFVPYDEWARAGYIQVTPGNVADFDAIGAAAASLSEKFRPVEIAFDRMFAGATINHLMALGLSCIGVGQGFYSMALPCAELERAVLGRFFRHGNNPVLNWNASNVVVTRDAVGNMKPDHRKAGERIDGMQALLTAMARAASPEAKERSPYSADRGLLVL